MAGGDWGVVLVLIVLVDSLHGDTTPFPSSSSSRYMDFSPFRFRHFQKYEPPVCLKGKWMQEYTNLHRDIMSGAAPPKFLVSTCGKYLQKNQGRSHDCSGLGNQLEVLEALLIASIATKRALLIGGYDANLLAGAILSPAINWSLRDALTKIPGFFKKKWVHTGFQKNDGAPRNSPIKTRSCSFQDLKGSTDEVEVLYITEKGPRSLMAIKMIELGCYSKEVEASENLLSYWGAPLQELMQAGCFLRYLIQPGTSFLDLMNQHHISEKLGSMLSFSTHFRFGDSVFGKQTFDMRKLPIQSANKLLDLGEYIIKHWNTEECLTQMTTSRKRNWPNNATVFEAVFGQHFHQKDKLFAKSVKNSNYFAFLASDNASYVAEATNRDPLHRFSGKEIGPILHSKMIKGRYAPSNPSHFFSLDNSSSSFSSSSSPSLFSFSPNQEMEKYLLRVFLDFFMIGFVNFSVNIPIQINTFTITSIRYSQVPVIDGFRFLYKKAKPSCSEQFKNQNYPLHEPILNVFPAEKICNYLKVELEGDWVDETNVMLSTLVHRMTRTKRQLAGEPD